MQGNNTIESKFTLTYLLQLCVYCVCCAQCTQHFILTNKITTYCHYLQQLKVPIWTGSLTAFALYRFSPFWNSSALPLAKQEYNLQHTGNVICSTTCVHVRCSQCHDTVFRPGFKDKMLLITIHMCFQFGINDDLNSLVIEQRTTYELNFGPQYAVHLHIIIKVHATWLTLTTCIDKDFVAAMCCCTC